MNPELATQWTSVEALLKSRFAQFRAPVTPVPSAGEASVRPIFLDYWSLEISPPCPSKWPVAPDTPLSYYAYASRFQPDLCDAIEVAGPWGVVVAISGELTFNLLAQGLASSGVESRYPPGPALIQLWDDIKRSGPVERLLITAATDVTAALLLRRFYSHWTARSSVGRDVLSRHHELARFLASGPPGSDRRASG